MYTHRLNKNTDLLRLDPAAFGTNIKASITGFIRLPLSMPEKLPGGPCWQVLLEIGGDNRGVMPFEIIGDVVLGRGSGTPESPDLDLTGLDAIKHGISRRHALLRPTPRKLYIIDLGSTNGTLVNGGPMGQGRAQALVEGDQISLGKLNLRITYLRDASREEDIAEESTLPPGSAAADKKLPSTDSLGTDDTE